MPSPIVVEKGTEPLGEHCALCKQPFTRGDEVIPCPACGAVHHTYCWVANHNHCTTLGCAGAEPVTPIAQLAPVSTVAPPPVREAAPARRGNGRPERRRPLRDRPVDRAAEAVAAAPEAAPVAAPVAAAVSADAAPATPAVPGVGRAAAPAARPVWHTQIAQSCLILAIAVAIVVVAFSCFGLWAIVDYLMFQFGWQYRPVPQGAAPLDHLVWTAAAIRTII